MSSVRLFTLEGTQRRHPEVENWFETPSSPLRALARRWFDVMRSCGPDVAEVLHDGHPTACVDAAAFGYVNAFRDHVNVGFFGGATLPDPAGLLEGSGRFMRHVKVRPGENVDEHALSRLIASAYQQMKDEWARRSQ